MRRLILCFVLAFLCSSSISGAIVNGTNISLTSANTPFTDTFVTPGFATTVGTYAITVPAGQRVNVVIQKAVGTLHHAYGPSVKVYKDGSFVQSISSTDPISVPFASSGTLKISAYCKAKDRTYTYVPSGLVHNDGTPYLSIKTIPYQDGYYQVSLTISLSYSKLQSVTFDPMGGSLVSKVYEYAVGMQYGALPTPTRTNYTFDGWYTAKSGGSKVTQNTIMNASVLKLFARWTYSPAVYSITYSPGKYGNGLAVSASKTYGVSTRILGSRFNRSGYVQTGWSLSAEGVKEDYAFNQLYVTNADLALYPYWTKVYDDVSISPQNVAHDCPETNGILRITADGPWTVSCRTANNWVTLSRASGSGNGTVKYTLERNYGASERSVYVDVIGTSSAAWSRITQDSYMIDINWDFAGGHLKGYTSLSDEYKASAVFSDIAPVPVREGFVLLGWGKSGIVSSVVTPTNTLKAIFGYFAFDGLDMRAHWRPSDLVGASSYFEFKPEADEDGAAAGKVSLPFVVWGQYDSVGTRCFSFVAKETVTAPIYVKYDGEEDEDEVLVKVYSGYSAKEDCYVGGVSGGSYGKVALKSGTHYVVSLEDTTPGETRSKYRKGSFRLQVGGTPLVNFLAEAEISYASVQNGQVCLGWHVQSGAEKYEVWRSVGNSASHGAITYGSERKIASVSVPGDRDFVEFTDNAVTDVLVRYRIRAVAGSLAGPLSRACEVNMRAYDLTFCSDYGTVPQGWTCEVGRIYQLPKMRVPGHRFQCWQCSNGRLYDDGMLVFNLAKPGETVTMTAIWE